jgi:hypothetical protein
MKKRFIQIILFMPCCIFDGLQVFFIVLPYYLFTGNNTKFESKLFELFND